MSRYILALDQGTTSSRAIVFDRTGAICGIAQKEFEQYYPQPGWVEHEPKEIWLSQLEVAQRVLESANVGPGEIASIGITNQRETTLLWDRRTGVPVSRAIVWQDRRTAGFTEELKRQGRGPDIQRRTGLLLDPYFSASKVAWILENVPGVRARAEAGELAFGTVDSWLIWKLTGGRKHVTDATNASRTMLFNLETGGWDSELLSCFGIPASVLPEICSSSEVIGEVVCPELPLKGVPLGGVVGDQQGALIGQLCLQAGQTKTTYGTGCFMLQSTGGEIRRSQHRLVSTLASRLRGVDSYAVEGSVFIAGAVVQWLRDGLGIIRDSAEVMELAASVPDNGGVCLVPAFAGLGAPHWDARARGMMIGLTRGTTKGHIARAALESIAFQVADLFDAMTADTGCRVQEMRVDGGAACNDLLMQFQSDLLGIPLVRPAVTETTALGAAILAGLAVGYWKSFAEIASLEQQGTRFDPQMGEAEVSRLRETWRRGVERAREWELTPDRANSESGDG